MGRDNGNVSERKGGISRAWFYEIIDILASNYGWRVGYILKNLTLVDLLGYLYAIEKRTRSESLLSLAIVHNPFSENPNELFRSLRGSEVNKSIEKIDRNSIEKLKKELKKSKVIKVK